MTRGLRRSLRREDGVDSTGDGGRAHESASADQVDQFEAHDDVERKTRLGLLAFLQFILVVTVTLIATSPTHHGAVALAASGMLAASSVFRYRRLASSLLWDAGAVALISIIGWGLGGRLDHFLGIVFIHMLLCTLDVSRLRVALNAALHLTGYYAIVLVIEGTAGLTDVATLTNMAGFFFVAGLMHALATLFAEQARLKAEVSHRAFHDTLTGLPNRDLLADRLEGQVLSAL
jgi:hypothetical protein